MLACKQACGNASPGSVVTRHNKPTCCNVLHTLLLQVLL